MTDFVKQELNHNMNLSVIGVGHVGIVTAACFASMSNPVICCDRDKTKIDLIRSGQSPVAETGVAELLSAALADGFINGTCDVEFAVANSDISIVCVGTPTDDDGNVDESAIAEVCSEICDALKQVTASHTVVIRSTLAPGMMRRVVFPALQLPPASSVGPRIGLVYCPEFLRETSAVDDFFNPSRTVIGVDDEFSANQARLLFKGIPGETIVTTPDIAEMVKYVDNVWHATKVVFGNEMGNICAAVGVDSWKVMDIFCADTKLNMSKSYLRPGFAFGGSCLPKEVRGLRAVAHMNGLNLPLVDSLIPSNTCQIDRVLTKIEEIGARSVSLLGLAFKFGADDIRESPLVKLAVQLIENGHRVSIYDPHLVPAKILSGQYVAMNRLFAVVQGSLVSSYDAALAQSELVIIGHEDPSLADIAGRLDTTHHVFDLARVPGLQEALADRYTGANW